MNTLLKIVKSLLIILLALNLISCNDEAVAVNPDKDKVIQIVNEMWQDAADHDAKVAGVLVGVWDNNSNDLFLYTKGFADLDTKELLTRQHSFKIASITKTIVCTIIAQMIDEGKLSYNSKLSTWFPDLNEADNITIRMLGDMTSGYPDYLVDEFEEKFDNIPYFKATQMELVEAGLEQGMFYTPGEGFNYSNTNTVLLGLIIEKISGNSLENEMKARIFNPLNLAKTGAPAEGSYMPEPRAESYHPVTDENWTDKMDYSPEYACGNAYSVFDDLKIYLEALVNGKLESSQTFENRFIKGNLLHGDESFKYYFGLIDHMGFKGHSGNTDYYTSEAYYNPSLKKGIIIFSNTSVTGFTSLMFKKIAAELIEEEK